MSVLCRLQGLQEAPPAHQACCCSIIPTGKNFYSNRMVPWACGAIQLCMHKFLGLQAPATQQEVADILTRTAEVVQLYRYPGLSKSAAATLLRKVTGRAFKPWPVRLVSPVCPVLKLTVC